MPFVEALYQDVRYAVRTFRKSPGFTAVVVISIALGIAANTTVFTIVNATLLGALPVRDPNSLVSFDDGNSMPYPDYLDYRDQCGSVFESVIAQFPLVPASLNSGGVPERVWGQLVTGNWFRTLGIAPVAGRFILPEEDAVQGRDAVLVLSHGLWKRRFGSRPSVVGSRVFVNGQPYTVVGIAPPGFYGIDRGLVAEFWVPLAMHGQIMPELARYSAMSRDNSWLSITARLKPGVTREQAAAALKVVTSRIVATWHKGEKFTPIVLRPAGGIIGARSFVVGLMATMMIITALVLLVACANVANIMLARAAGRSREIGIRLTVGAARGRLVRQLLTESILLSLAGAACGLVLATVAAGAIARLELPLPFPIHFDFSPDARIFAFTAALALLTGIVFGLVPAFRATRVDLVSSFKDTGGALGSFRRFGLRNALVVVQVTLSLVLLVSAGLFLRSLQNASSIDTGMRSPNVLMMAMDPKLHGYSTERFRTFLAQLDQRISALPGVESASFVDIVPLSIGSSSSSFTASGGSAKREVNADNLMTGDRYFETMGIPLLRGSRLDRSSAAGAVLINENMARRLFPSGDALGQMVGHGGKSHQVIGIVGNTKSRTLGEDPRAVAYTYLPAGLDTVSSFFGVSILVKTSGAPEAMVRPVREQVEALDRNLAVFNIDTMRDHVGKALLVPRLCAVLFAVFGAVGLSLAAIGLYGVMSYSVRSRTREIGIRVALGAASRSVVGMVARQGVVLVAVGLALGVGIALAAGRLTASLLYNVSPSDPVTYAAVSAVLLGVAFLAIAVPARRASRIHPMEALRQD